ncbi:hypothetical protein PLICRDRAFT_25619 [Plicaturopsis crispa FD-325 SS-3]|nr:hypothetical protein PLICRDRAFT_25619 [Plicaturopsis crispa FD-325 SS-3]
MATDTPEGEEMDVETLQAQIDLSMSFAQNMVASWIKPSSKSLVKSQNDTERELQEYMRRPARLGVGAPIPESAGTSRDAARLKNHLTGKGGKKRAREEDDEVKQREPSDDEGESRGGAIKRKLKVDPFGTAGSKRNKKKKLEQSGSATQPIPAASPPTPNTSVGTALADANANAADTSTVNTSFTKPHKKKKKHDTSVTHSPLPNAISVGESSRSSLTSPNIPRSSPGPTTSEPSAHQKLPNGSSQKLNDTTGSLPPTISPSRNRKPDVVMNIPLLNLDGPPAYIEDDNKGEGSPKKKRKRRKKKKVVAGDPATGES